MIQYHSLTVLEILKKDHNGRRAPFGEPLRGLDKENFGHDWAEYQYDSLDRHVDNRLKDFGQAIFLKWHAARASAQNSSQGMATMCVLPI